MEDAKAKLKLAPVDYGNHVFDEAVVLMQLKVVSVTPEPTSYGLQPSHE
jgi:hypothetical protein